MKKYIKIASVGGVLLGSLVVYQNCAPMKGLNSAKVNDSVSTQTTGDAVGGSVNPTLKITSMTVTNAKKCGYAASGMRTSSLFVAQSNTQIEKAAGPYLIGLTEASITAPQPTTETKRGQAYTGQAGGSQTYVHCQKISENDLNALRKMTFKVNFKNLSDEVKTKLENKTVNMNILQDKNGNGSCDTSDVVLTSSNAVPPSSVFQRVPGFQAASTTSTDLLMATPLLYANNYNDLNVASSSMCNTAPAQTSKNSDLEEVPSSGTSTEDCGCEQARTEEPLMVDLNNDGLALSDLNQGARFDITGSGVKDLVSWPLKADDVFLVRDLNGNGLIDGGQEMFGDQTRLKNGTYAVHGFAAIADIDSNRDGQIDASELRMNKVMVWADVNRNGISEREELFYADATIASISLAYKVKQDRDHVGNLLFASSTAKLTNSKVVPVHDVWLRAK